MEEWKEVEFFVALYSNLKRKINNLSKKYTVYFTLLDKITDDALHTVALCD